jgi:hypothetical protein
MTQERRKDPMMQTRGVSLLKAMVIRIRMMKSA